MPTETQHLEQRVAALQSDLNERDQRTDDLQFQLKDREGSRRDWFEEAQRLQAQLAERDALLTEVIGDVHFVIASDVRQRIEAALCASAVPSAPVERDERAEFEAWARTGIDPLVDGDFRWVDSTQAYYWASTRSMWASWQARAALDKSTEGASYE
ncbi:hypothetical protein ABCR88_21010 [Pseudomonas sp. W17]|uniref:Uncharacterized protein n=1 Tax=Pseudomonas sp. W17 TaxID=3144407 RepID=A0AAU7WN27_9PSED